MRLSKNVVKGHKWAILTSVISYSQVFLYRIQAFKKIHLFTFNKFYFVAIVKLRCSLLNDFLAHLAGQKLLVSEPNPLKVVWSTTKHQHKIYLAF